MSWELENLLAELDHRVAELAEAERAVVEHEAYDFDLIECRNDARDERAKAFTRAVKAALL